MDESPGSVEQPRIIRGRLKEEGKSKTFNELWTPEEQHRLEELLIKYPAEEVEARRWAKIAAELGNRTPNQVGNRTLNQVGNTTPNQVGNRTLNQVGNGTPNQVGNGTPNQVGAELPIRETELPTPNQVPSLQH